MSEGKAVGGQPLFRRDDLLARARAELRLGLPLRLEGGGTPTALVMAAELVEERWLAALLEAGNGSVDLVISRQRAETLQVRVYDGVLARIPLEKDATARAVAALADPSRDLDHPLRGPFPSRRGGNAEDAARALQLMRRAGLLAAALVAVVPDSAAKTWRPAARLPRNVLASAASPPVIERVASARMPVLQSEDAHVHLFRERDSGDEHLAFELGPPGGTEAPLVRVHSSCYTGDVLGSLRCDCGPQLREAIGRAAREGGLVMVLQQEGRGIGLANKIRAYALQDQGFDTYEANRRLGFGEDERNFGVAAEIMRSLGFLRVRLMTGNPEKAAAIRAHGIEVAEILPHSFGENPHNARYLEAKRRRGGKLA